VVVTPPPRPPQKTILLVFLEHFFLVILIPKGTVIFVQILAGNMQNAWLYHFSLIKFLKYLSFEFSTVYADPFYSQTSRPGCAVVP
jgi:hypothetical protein